MRIAGADHWAAIEDAGRLRDALGTALPVGVPEAFTEPVKDPLGDLLARYARTHGPFTTAEPAARFGLGVAVADGALRRLAGEGRVAPGRVPARAARARSGATPRCCAGCGAAPWPRCGRSSSRCRRRRWPGSCPQWQHIGTAAACAASTACARAVEQLQGASVPASALEKLVLPSRVPGYTPRCSTS